ncbi:MAG: bifunctional riboflavin kinase/FAD synthetase [Helicobacteraceae bacterium]|nr:bifunctional riboflavin kinase/FAD synthetase [Helicobacteraceae bacterium]
MLSTATALKKIDSIAIGGFDGMHYGHQHLFEELGENGAILVIETGYANLTPSRERERFTHYPIEYYPLDSIRHLKGEEFIKKIKDQFPLLKKIVVGYDFHFGKDRKYSFNDLRTLFGGEVVVVDEVSLHNDSVHSHKIRAKLEIGDIKGANQFLSHNYTIHGKVVKGQGIGKKELFATINILTDGFLIPKEGVYASLTRIDDSEHYYPSVSFLGHRVTTDGSFAIESHILTDENIECKESASISFIAFIRENQRFENLIELKTAIQKDINLAKKELTFIAL